VSAYLTDMWNLARAGALQGIWFFAALYGVLMGLYSVLFQLRIRCWPRTVGTLHRLGVEVFGGRDAVVATRETVGVASYTYAVDGRSYDGTRISAWVMVAGGLGRLLKLQQRGVQRHDGGGVTVFYHPRKPAKSFLIRPGWLGLALTLALGSALAVGYFVRFHF